LTSALGLMYEAATHGNTSRVISEVRLMKTLRKLLERLRLPLPALA
jgi:hypothetical protein